MPDTADITNPLPAEDDWHGWSDILTRDDTGRVDCVPDCLRHLVDGHVGPDGRLTEPSMSPSTPYGVAKFMLVDHPLPWRGTGLTPDCVRSLLAQGLSGDAIIEAVTEAEKPSAPAVIAAETQEKFSSLYMIRSEDGPIKIGISAEPSKRLKALQTGHPYRLEIVCTVPGGAELESEYHARFAEHRLHSEWFAPHPDILAEIERLASCP